MNNINVPSREYFHHYDPPETALKTAGYFIEALQASKEKISSILKRRDNITILSFGSATERNIDELRRFMQLERPAQYDKDHFLIIDIADHPLKKHMEYIAKNEYDNVSVIKGDMNRVPLPYHSIDLLITDCTMNFNLTVEDYSATIASISDLLATDGQCIATLSIHPETDQPENDLYLRQTSVRTTAIKKLLLFKMLEEQSLSHEIVEEMNDWPWSPSIRLILRRLHKNKPE